MLEFNNVSKSFWVGTQRKVVLDRVSFRVEFGTSLGILAPNGTGKTTLIKIMAGLEKPDEGVINRYCNVSFPLGFMDGVVNKHTAQENCRYIAKLYGLDPDYVEAYCRWLCNLHEYFDQPLGVYSSGMRARWVRLHKGTKSTTGFTDLITLRFLWFWHRRFEPYFTELISGGVLWLTICCSTYGKVCSQNDRFPCSLSLQSKALFLLNKYYP